MEMEGSHAHARPLGCSSLANLGACVASKPSGWLLVRNRGGRATHSLYNWRQPPVDLVSS